MEQIYHIGECRICGGRMELYYYFSSGKISTICEECLVEFDSINDYKNFINGHRDFYDPNEVIFPLVRPANLEEIKNSEWYPYVVEKDFDLP